MSAVNPLLPTEHNARYQIQLPTGLLEIRADDGCFELDELVGFAARANAKRGFLFLSKVLGKHWPVTPKLMHSIHLKLASQIPGNLAEPVVFIAMAETAIGLGQGVFETYKNTHPNREALFLHTSRYRVDQLPIIEFEESHSHAPRQFLHVPDDHLQHYLLRARTLVLIDDEASTGNTFLNLTNACRKLSPDIEHVYLSTITNFMGQKATQQLSKRFGLPVSMGAAFSGEYSFTAASDLQAYASPDLPLAQCFDPLAECGASRQFGRLGMDKPVVEPCALAQQLASEIQADERVLVLGTGEFMHNAFLLGKALEACGKAVVVQSTTRSPILRWGAVTHCLSFPDNYNEGINNYLYNVVPGYYDHVFICHETLPNPALYQLASLLSGRLFYFQSEKHIEEISIR